MEKTIRIDGKDVRFKATAATIRMYRQLTGRDMLLDMQKLQQSGGEGSMSVEALTVFENVAFVMAKQADPDGVPDTPDEWLDGFEMFSIYTVLPQIVELWHMNELGTSKPKKK